MQTPPNQTQIESILKFLPAFGRAAPGHITWHSKPGTMPHSSLSEAASEFYRALGAEGFVIQFDWPKWQHEGMRFVERPELIASADLHTLCQLITTHVRKERFCEGHFASVLESGQFAAILQRLAILHQESDRAA